MTNRDLAERIEGIVSDVSNNVLNDQRVATDSELVRQTYDVLEALVTLHNRLDPEEELVLE